MRMIVVRRPVMMFAVLGAVLIAPSVASAVPTNDNRANAQAIAAVPFSASGSTAGATLEPQEPMPPWCGSIGATVWYRFTATQTLPLAVSSAGSNFDTILAVWRVTGSGLQPLDCNDDIGAHAQSFVSFPAVAGDTFFIQLGGWSGATGPFKLRLTYGGRFGAPLLLAGAGGDSAWQEAEFETGFFVGGALAVGAAGSVRAESGSFKEYATCVWTPVAAVGSCP